MVSAGYLKNICHPVSVAQLLLKHIRDSENKDVEELHHGGAATLSPPTKIKGRR
jgi:hypothetical protein